MPRASKEEKVFLARKRQILPVLNQMLRSVSVSDSRKVPMVYLAVLLDADPDTLRPFMMDWIRAQFIDKRGIKWKENDGSVEERASQDDLDAGAQFKTMLEEFLKVKE